MVTTWVIGRAGVRGEADILVDDPHVSIRHAEVSRLADGSYRVRDLGSAIGTYLIAPGLNGGVKVKGDPVAWLPGWTLVVGRGRITRPAEGAPHA